MTPEALLELFRDAADAVRDAVAGINPGDRRLRTKVHGQYHLDVVADDAALPLLHAAGVRVLSEESGVSGPDDAPVTVVLDPVDGSTNCARDIPYWAISLCAVDASGPFVALVRNQATGVSTTAVRGSGAWRDDVAITASDVTDINRAVVALGGFPARRLRWAQFRALGSAALALCDVAAGRVDGIVEAGSWTKPWDYMGGVLACREAGAVVEDFDGRDLDEVGADVRRQVFAASTPELMATLRTAVGP